MEATATKTDAVTSFRPITLNEMDRVKLMERTDTKFIFRRDQLPAILEALRPSYRMLEVNGVRMNRYETLYFDTSRFDLYLQHHNRHANRQKIRYRRYVESDLNYFEIKTKNNKGKTIKNRVKQEGLSEIITGKAEHLLAEKTSLKPSSLAPAMWVHYKRLTLVSNEMKERLTLDVDLSYRNGSASCEVPELVIAELKRENAHASAFTGIMRSFRIKEVSISKYCFGIVFLNRDIRKNNFKPKLITLNKLLYGTATGRGC